MSDNENQVTEEVVIPDKMYFKIGEVSQITGVKPYILRYWETEFPIINPAKRKNKHRLYRRKDVEDILLIKRLLYEQKYTIAGARMKLKERHRLNGEATASASTINTDDLPTMTETEDTFDGDYTESTVGLTTTTDLQLTTLEEFANNPGSQQAVQEVLKELESIKDLLEA